MMSCFAVALTLVVTPQGPAPRVETIPVDLAAWRALPRVERKVTERGQAATYAGVPLAALLKGKTPGENRMADLRSLSDAVLILRGTDGYQVCVSAAAAAIDEAGERYLLAIEKDGMPLPAGQGPARLIVPAEALHARWIREIASIQLVRFGGQPARP